MLLILQIDDLLMQVCSLPSFHHCNDLNLPSGLMSPSQIGKEVCGEDGHDAHTVGWHSLHGKRTAKCWRCVRPTPVHLRSGWLPPGNEGDLILAANRGKLADVRAAHNAGADLEAVDSGKGFTAVAWAARHGWTDIVKLLLSLGVDPNYAGPLGCAHVLFPAFSTGDVYVSTGDWLLKMSLVCLKRWTPLHMASERGHTDVVALLLEQGANSDPKTMEGTTPMMLAVEYGERCLCSVVCALPHVE